MTAIRSTCLLVVLLTFGTACALNKPITGGDHSAATAGTVSGVVSTDAGKTPVTGRMVTAINTSTQAHFDATTATNGGYTMNVPAGRYTIDVELRTGERLEKRPDPTVVAAGDLDAGRDFVITR